MKVFTKKKFVPAGKFVPPKDQMNMRVYNFKKTIDPLKDKYPRSKNGSWSNRKEQRKEVREILVPWTCNFVKTCLKWNKMPKYYRNDNRTILTQYFVGKNYRSVLWNGDNIPIQTKIWYKPNQNGKLIMDAVKKEKPEFTDTEILDTLIFVVYKFHVDHYSMRLKPSNHTNPLKQENVSLWDKISENVQV